MHLIYSSDKEAKFDISYWSVANSKMDKGITLNKVEFGELKYVLSGDI